nr:DapH/DapD/GlmU-related protein [Adlercreutzia rubneri]
MSHGSYGREGCDPRTPPNDRPLVGSPVTIGDNVWLGENVVVLQGVTIGSGCIIGANSTVSRSIPENCIAVGSPARPIKAYDDETGSWVPYRAEG